MTTCRCKDLKVKVKDVKILHLMKENKMKLQAWGLGGLFSADWSQSHEELRKVYNLPKTSPEGYVMKGKVQFTELQLLKLEKGDKILSKSGVLLKQVEGNPDFILFCQILNSVLAPVRPEHFQHNQLAFYHYAWLAILDPTSPMPDWEDAVEKTVT
ncbi:hypothetical protein R1flu_027600 [Riccia fluitans]|uniref:Uncharacterized protein n=1 Tax=Riccia fluitans TaxID=41844 RepID=A0ABD1XJB3_9MARC